MGGVRNSILDRNCQPVGRRQRQERCPMLPRLAQIPARICAVAYISRFRRTTATAGCTSGRICGPPHRPRVAWLGLSQQGAGGICASTGRIPGLDEYLIRQQQVMDMNRDRIEGSWKQLRGKAGERWSKLIGDESGVNAARHTRLAGSVQVRQGISKEETERQLRDFLYRNRDWNLSRRWSRP